MKTIKWAVNATGNIAHNFADGMRFAEGAEIVAVSSSNIEHARSFASEFGINEENCFSDLEEMLSEIEVDAVYVCTPNHLHFEQCLLSIKHGKNVLCEKPMGDNLKQTKALIDAAKEADVFLMEGMWSRFFPAVRKVRAWLSEGKIGRPRTFFASFGTDQQSKQSQWRYDSKSSGGALRDVAIYTIAFSSLVFGKAKAWKGNCELNEAGIDVFNNIMLTYGEDEAAFMSSSLNSSSPYDLRIVGTEGQIVIEPYFWKPQKACLYRFDGTTLGQDCVEVFEEEYSGSGFQYEIMAVSDCIRENKKVSDEYSFQETLEIAELLEEIRKSWGIVYKSDQI